MLIGCLSKSLHAKIAHTSKIHIVLILVSITMTITAAARASANCVRVIWRDNGDVVLLVVQGIHAIWVCHVIRGMTVVAVGVVIPRITFGQRG